MGAILDKAILFATAAHKGQIRKLGKKPYILHPLEASIIVSSLTDDEEIIVAALLHDVVEDTDFTIEDIKENFGERVAVLVSGETENKRRDIPAEKTWKIRKEESLAHLKNCNDEAVKMMWLGDKLSNARSIYRSYLEIGDDLFGYFNQKDKNEHEWYYRKVLEYTENYRDSAPWIELCEIVNNVFK